MRIKLDENLPSELIQLLELLGHDVDSVPSENLTGQPDQSIWQAAQSADRFLITQDLDFSDVRQFKPGTHAGIMLVRLRFPSRRALIGRIETVFERERPGDWKGCFVVVSDRKVRIRRP